MRVLVTGHHGYIGSMLAPMLPEAGHDVVGLDTFFYRDCDFGRGDSLRAAAPTSATSPAELRGFDAVVHLAALSNDPLGDLDEPDLRHQPRRHAASRRGRRERPASTLRFRLVVLHVRGVRATSLGRDWPLRPLTPYAESKVRAEEGLSRWPTTFSPVSLRNATAYGASPRLRLDVVLNNLAGGRSRPANRALGDGSAWRPIVHVRDIGRATRRARRTARAGPRRGVQRRRRCRELPRARARRVRPRRAPRMRGRDRRGIVRRSTELPGRLRPLRAAPPRPHAHVDRARRCRRAGGGLRGRRACRPRSSRATVYPPEADPAVARPGCCSTTGCAGRGRPRSSIAKPGLPGAYTIDLEPHRGRPRLLRATVVRERARRGRTSTRGPAGQRRLQPPGGDAARHALAGRPSCRGEARALRPRRDPRRDRRPAPGLRPRSPNGSPSS